MTLIQLNDPNPRPAVHKAGVHGLSLAVTGWIGARTKRQRRLRELEELARNPDWQLADIGIERSEIIRERRSLARG